MPNYAPNGKFEKEALKGVRLLKNIDICDKDKLNKTHYYLLIYLLMKNHFSVTIHNTNRNYTEIRKIFLLKWFSGINDVPDDYFSEMAKDKPTTI